jgi:hypothetical protein
MQSLLNERLAKIKAGLEDLLVLAREPDILWRDGIQEDAPLCGFNQIRTDHPGGVIIPPSDEGGANVSRVFIDGSYALRHFVDLDGGARSQVGIWSFRNQAFGDQVKKPEGVYVASELKFPAAFQAGTDNYPWLGILDWHSKDAEGTNRWYTGLNLAADGSMRFAIAWGGPSYKINPPGVLSAIPLPVGRWFDFETHYVWSETNGKISAWIDGQLAVEQTGVATKAPTHTDVEVYPGKLYGASIPGHIPWTPNPAVSYVRNVRVSGERMWR